MSAQTTAHAHPHQLTESLASKVVRSGLPTQAERRALNALEVGPETDTLWVTAANAQRLQGKWQEAADSYRHAARCASSPKAKADHERCARILGNGLTDYAPPERWPISPFLYGEDLLSPDLLAALCARYTKPGRQGETFAPDSRVHRDAQMWPLTEPLLHRVLEETSTFIQRAAQALTDTPLDRSAVQYNLLGYNENGGYHAHQDQGTLAQGSDTARRTVTIVHYLRVDTDRLSGGDLLLYDRNNRSQTLIRPRSGLSVAFRSDSMHEVTSLHSLTRDGSAPRRDCLVLWFPRAG